MSQIIRRRPVGRLCAGAVMAALATLMLVGHDGARGASPAASSAAAAAPWPPSGGRGSCAVSERKNVPVKMRDGTILRADVYTPKTSQKVPVILYRTQYDKEVAQVTPSRYQAPSWFASHCYVVATMDVRGQYASSGTFYEFRQDQNDGYDSVEWAAGLPGSDGKVGMYGSSYNGADQWLAEETRPPHLVTIIPSNTASDYYDNWTYEGGEFRLNFVEPWAMGDIVLSAAENRHDTKLVKELKTANLNIAKWMAFTPYDKFTPFHPGDPKVAPYFFDWIHHASDDAFWRAISPNAYYRTMNIPVLNFEGWYDAFLAGGVQNFTGMTQHAASAYARANQHIVIGPWDHIGWGRPASIEAPMLKAIGPAGNSPVNEMMLAWWNHYLKGESNGVGTGAKVNYFLMGANVWKTARAWPLPGTRFERYYLKSDGQARSNLGDGALTRARPASAESPDRYTYDPRNPVPSVGGHSCCESTGGSQGPYDQNAVEERPDVLVYTSPVLTHATQVTGPMSVTLYAKSSAPDTDWTAKVDVVRSDGTVVNLNNGILRASFRRSLSHPTPITPGKVYRYRITVWPSAYELAPGDALRLEVSSSDYPQFAPNPNTGARFGTTSSTRVAHQTVLHDRAHPSEVTLPIVPAAASGGSTPRFPLPHGR